MVVCWLVVRALETAVVLVLSWTCSTWGWYQGLYCEMGLSLQRDNGI